MAARNFKLFLGCLGNGVTSLQLRRDGGRRFQDGRPISNEGRNHLVRRRGLPACGCSRASGPAQSRNG